MKRSPYQWVFPLYCYFVLLSLNPALVFFLALTTNVLCICLLPISVIRMQAQWEKNFCLFDTVSSVIRTVPGPWQAFYKLFVEWICTAFYFLLIFILSCKHLLKRQSRLSIFCIMFDTLDLIFTYYLICYLINILIYFTLLFPIFFSISFIIWSCNWFSFSFC